MYPFGTASNQETGDQGEVVLGTWRRPVWLVECVMSTRYQDETALATVAFCALTRTRCMVSLSLTRTRCMRVVANPDVDLVEREFTGMGK